MDVPVLANEHNFTASIALGPVVQTVANVIALRSRPRRRRARGGSLRVAPITSGRAPAPPVEVRAAGGVAPLVARTA